MYDDARRYVLGVQTLDVIDIQESGDQLFPFYNSGGKGGLMEPIGVVKAASDGNCSIWASVNPSTLYPCVTPRH